MNKLDLADVQDRFADDFRPTECRYSIILINRQQPHTDPDYVTKGYETDDISDIQGLPDQLGMSIVAIRDDRAVIELASSQ